MSVVPDPAAVAAIGARLARIRALIADAAVRAGRDATEVRLVAASKTVELPVVRAAIAAGVGEFGENRVQELVDKRRELPDVRWHLIGRLQRNKVRFVVDGSTLVHSVDRPELVDAIEHRAARVDTVQPVLLQVNVGDDPAKGGCRVERLAELVAYAHGHSHVRVQGLMTVPPLSPPGTDPAVSARRHYATLRQLRDEFVGADPAIGALSMGMSADFVAAVEEGATIVRIGAALFGPRDAGPTGKNSTEDPR